MQPQYFVHVSVIVIFTLYFKGETLVPSLGISILGGQLLRILPDWPSYDLDVSA